MNIYHQTAAFSIQGQTVGTKDIERGLISLAHVWTDAEGRLCGQTAKNLFLPSSGQLVREGISPHRAAPSERMPSHIYFGENDVWCLSGRWQGCIVEGWHGARGDTPTFRWTARSASFFLEIPGQAATLFIKVSDPAADSRNLEGRVLFDHALLGEFNGLGLEPQTLSFALNGESTERPLITIEVEPTITSGQSGIAEDNQELGLVAYEAWAE